jgi:hypothetical protein
MKIGETQEYLGWTIERESNDMNGRPRYMAGPPPGKAIEPCCGKGILECGRCGGQHTVACWGMGLRSLKAELKLFSRDLEDCPNCEIYPPPGTVMPERPVIHLTNEEKIKLFEEQQARLRALPLIHFV